jgi:hypothetical protein
MQITKRRLKEIIKEEESEKMAFQIILEKLSPEQLEEMGLKRI